MLYRRTALFACLCLASTSGCGKDDAGGTGGSSGSESGGITTAPTTSSPTTTVSSMSDTVADTSASETTVATEPPTDTSSNPGTEGSSGTDPSTTGNPGGALDCDGAVYQCGDGLDNDRDGSTDLFDPECTGPCDDDESSFQTGLPGDNMDCKQDCFFDGNSGQGDDGCIWDLRCDPENPGALIGCEYTGGNNCDNQPPNQDAECIMFCEQYVPPGCDCFGCCEVQTADGPIHIFLNSGPDCSLDNLDACESCTYQIDDCGVPCVPELCQLCFGDDELPPGCDQPECVVGDPCVDTSECATDFYCLLGCCYPPPPG